MNLADMIRQSNALLPPNDAPHMLVKALAGTGKTTSVMAGVAYMFRDKLKDLWARLEYNLGYEIKPSEQQLAVWEGLKQSAKSTKTVKVTAFSNAVVTETMSKWSWLAECLKPKGIHLEFATLHSAGNFALHRHGTYTLDPTALYDLIDLTYEKHTGKSSKNLREKYPVVSGAVHELVRMVKVNLIPVDIEDESDREAVNGLLQDLADHYAIDLEGEDGTDYTELIFDLVPKVIHESKSPRERIDFDDMIWLPVALGLDVVPSDLLLVDEAQDLSRCQQAVARRLGKRMVYVGDPRQAIFGFNGADHESMPSLEKELRTSKLGCQSLALTTSYRCSKRVVEEARTIVPEFRAHEANHDGAVHVTSFGSYPGLLRPGDLVISRVNAPLFSQCYELIRAGRRASVIGRDITGPLISLVHRMRAHSVPHLITRLRTWAEAEIDRENKKPNPNRRKIANILDREDCVVRIANAEGFLGSVNGVIARIRATHEDTTPNLGVRFGTIHAAKGLEADRVFFIDTDKYPCPHPMARLPWERVQEDNMKYVGITRAKHTLTWVN